MLGLGGERFEGWGFSVLPDGVVGSASILGEHCTGQEDVRLTALGFRALGFKIVNDLGLRVSGSQVTVCAGHLRSLSPQPVFKTLTLQP